MLVPHGIQVEDRGGEVQAIPVSALNGTNLDTLSEAIVLQAELMNLKGDPRGKVEGVVVESRTDPQRGYGYFYTFSFHTDKSISSMHLPWVIIAV